MDVIVSGKANDEVITSLVNFRVEDAPPGRGSVFERVGGQDYNFVNSDKVSKESILYGLIRGEKPPGFLYDYDINVESFQITVGNLPTRTVQGNKIQNSNEAVRDINGANRGSSVTVTVLKAVKIDGDLKSTSDSAIDELQNTIDDKIDIETNPEKKKLIDQMRLKDETRY